MPNLQLMSPFLEVLSLRLSNSHTRCNPKFHRRVVELNTGLCLS